MREHLPKIIIIGLLVLIVGVPIVLRPANSAESDPNAPKLTIYTPHNEQIRFEIQTAFNEWRASQNLPEVVFDWRTPGGTSDIRKSILSQYKGLIDSGKDLDKQGIGADLFFGGGEYDHNKVAEGIEKESGEQTVTHRIVMSPQLDADLFAQAFPEPLIGGEKLYGTYTFEEAGEEIELIGWTGVTLSSFGIVFNRDSLKQLGIDEPKTWSDLGDPRLRGWVALADPGHSGSISATFDTILKREGWTDGWITLRNAFANARYFATSSDRVPVDVSRGDAAVGMCIDFYGRYQTGMVAPVTKAMAGEIHGDMVLAWRALNDAIESGHPKADEMRELFYKMPPELTLTWPDSELEEDWLVIQRDTDHPRHSEVVDHLGAFKNQLRALSDRNDASVLEGNRIKWRSFFQDSYREVVRLSQQ